MWRAPQRVHQGACADHGRRGDGPAPGHARARRTRARRAGRRRGALHLHVEDLGRDRLARRRQRRAVGPHHRLRQHRAGGRAAVDAAGPRPGRSGSWSSPGSQPGATYHYSIGGGPDLTFHTPPTGSFRFDAIGDVGDTSSFSKLGATLSGDRQRRPVLRADGRRPHLRQRHRRVDERRRPALQRHDELVGRQRRLHPGLGQPRVRRAPAPTTCATTRAGC